MAMHGTHGTHGGLGTHDKGECNRNCISITAKATEWQRHHFSGNNHRHSLLYRLERGGMLLFLAALACPTIVVLLAFPYLIRFRQDCSLFRPPSDKHFLDSTTMKDTFHVTRPVPYPVSPADSEPSLFDWEIKRFNSGFDDDIPIWQRSPDDKTDEAWDSLYKNVGITTVDKHAADLLPDSTIEFPGLKGQFVVGIGMFHQLHCLNMVRKAIYPEIYDRSDMHMGHVEHCLDQLRQVVMCNGDLSTVSWRWDVEKDIPVSKFDTTRMCRNFDRIHKWAEEVSLTEVRFNQLLRENGHNTLGDA